MSHFDPSTPRTACSIVAIAMATLTLGTMVVVPTKMSSDTADVISLESAKARVSSATEVAISPARIDVVGVREPDVALQNRNAAAKRKQQG